MAKIFSALILAVVIPSIRSTDSNICVQKSPCLCEFSENSKLDITEATQENHKPVNPDGFLAAPALNGDILYFSGCTDRVFNLSAHGINASSSAVLEGSLIHRSHDHVEVIGNSSQIKFNPPDINLGGIYDVVFKGVNGTVVAIIHLLCDNYNQPFLAVQTNTSNEQNLAWSSPHNCIITHHPGLSTGSVLVILFFIAFGIYFICGGIVLYFMRGARGLEVIPNIDFWRGLPGLVKDGIVFLFSGCRADAINTPETYDRI